MTSLGEGVMGATIIANGTGDLICSCMEIQLAAVWSVRVWCPW